MMPIKTPTEYKDEFTTIANDIVVAYNHYKSGKNTLDRLGVNVPSFSATLGEAIMKGFRSHIRDICNKVSKAYQGDTTQSFSYDSLDFDGLGLPCSLSRYDCKESEEFLVSEILSGFDFNTMVSELKNAASSLENEGKKEIAKSLTNELKLAANQWCSCVPKRTARHILVDGSHHKSYGGYYHSDVEMFHQLMQNMIAVAKEMGVPALPSAFHDLFWAVQAEGSHSDSIPSGTTFGSKDTVLIKVFKEHIRYSFVPEMMDAIFTYVKLYAPDINLCVLPQAA